MIQSFEEFKAGVYASLRDKVAERLEAEREYISNALLRGKTEETPHTETQSNADQN